MKLAKHKSLGTHQIFLDRFNGGSEMSQLIPKIRYTDDHIDAVSTWGKGLTLKRIYQNEWYGTTYLSEYQGDNHIMFTQPLKCKAAN